MGWKSKIKFLDLPLDNLVIRKKLSWTPPFFVSPPSEWFEFYLLRQIKGRGKKKKGNCTENFISKCLTPLQLLSTCKKKTKLACAYLRDEFVIHCFWLYKFPTDYLHDKLYSWKMSNTGSKCLKMKKRVLVSWRMPRGSARVWTTTGE